MPRSLTLKQEAIDSVDLHICGDVSILGNCAVAYAVVSQPSKVNQGLVASKSRLLKKDLMIPRLELIATHMAANLATNISKRFKHYISYRMDRQYCYFTLAEGSGKLQNIRREQS